jgi:aminopeptidase N
VIRVLTSVGVLAAFVGAGTATRDSYPRQPGVDVQHYRFDLALNDATDDIRGDAVVTVRFTQDGLTSFFLDLATVANGKGMTVVAVTSDSAAVSFTHRDNHLTLTLARPTRAGEVRRFRVQYHGIPAGGLTIGVNKYKERCFFSWNWPDKAHEWLPMIDHKATSEFIVTAPVNYSVVANGLLQSETSRGDGTTVTHWAQSVPISSWLNAIGVAQFAVHHAGLVRGVALQTWVAHQELENGILTFELPARRAVEFFSDYIGPYPYEKLANISAAFGGGGTEHASAIFSGESSVRNTPQTSLVAHEIAHQWFGDAVTEKDWDDAWLSEGFATYFTLLYTEHYDGRDAFVVGLQRARVSALAAEKRVDHPVVHQNPADLSGVIPGLVYQKGAWVLHMLRGQLGTETFRAAIQEYYRRDRDRNASSEDLQQVMEEVSGQKLDWFFEQWLHRTLSPAIEGSWTYDAARRLVVVELRQAQSGAPYRLPLDVGVLPEGANPLPMITTVEMSGASLHVEIPAATMPRDVVLDPNTRTLMDQRTFARQAP